MKRIINLSLIIGIIFLLQSFGCENSPESKWNLDFSKMEIHYNKIGGWIHPTKLDIYGSNGLITAYLFNQSSYTATDSASKILNKKGQDKIANLFHAFSDYDRHYEPGNWVTDQNTHTIILINDGIPDTVSVYMPENADIPLSLMKIILEMESLWEMLFSVETH